MRDKEVFRQSGRKITRIAQLRVPSLWLEIFLSQMEVDIGLD